MTRHRTTFGKSGFLYMVLGTVVVVASLITYNHFFPGDFTQPPSEMADCLKCHGAYKPQEGNFVHAPLQNCTTCHTLHALGEKSELVKPRQELCLSCHPNRSAKGDTIHGPYQANCLSCHDAHQSPFPGILVAEERSLCLTCHGSVEVADNPMQHRPFEESCVSCHPPHYAAEEKLLAAATPDLCYQCHSGTKLEGSKKVQHQPFAGGSCLDCHEAHSSPVAASALLIKQERALCLDCHSGDINLTAAVQHKPLSGDCSQCHEPHAADVSSLLARETPDLCYTCHASTRRELTAMPAQHKPFTAGSCMDCHEAHDSSFKGLLVQNERQLCLSCHSGSPEFAGTHMHQPVSQGCVSCHKPHAAPVSGLLAQHTPGLCYSCHGGTRQEFAMKSSHPVATGQMNCSSCHSGAHTGSNAMLLKATGNSLCSSCHGGLASTLQLTAHKGQNCAYCHTAHGSPQVSLLRRSEDDNCTVCHDRKKGTYMAGGALYRNHPTGVTDGMGQVIYCASCHDFHGPASKNLLRFDGRDRLCMNCHTLESLIY